MFNNDNDKNMYFFFVLFIENLHVIRKLLSNTVCEGIANDKWNKIVKLI